MKPPSLTLEQLMDLGYLTGNRVVIPLPTSEDLQDNHAVLRYLQATPKIRQEIFKLVKEKRTTHQPSVWVDHELLWFPILIHEDATNEIFLEEIQAYLAPHQSSVD
jgi:hypothetical protein